MNTKTITEAQLAAALEVAEKDDLIVLLGKPMAGRLDYLDAPREAAAAIFAALPDGSALPDQHTPVCAICGVDYLPMPPGLDPHDHVPDTGLDVEGVIAELMGAEGSLDKAKERLVKATDTLARLTSKEWGTEPHTSPTAEEDPSDPEHAWRGTADEWRHDR